MAEPISPTLTAKTAPPHLILVGMMGSGKSAVGALLSAQLPPCPRPRTFYDMDALIEQQEQCRVSDIFSRFGEAKFRLLESQLLQLLVSQATPSVIATGGGVVTQSVNRQWLKKGWVVYLRAEVAVLHDRLQNEVDNRPLLQTDDNLTVSLSDKLTTLLAQRDSLYLQVSDFVVEQTASMPPNEVAAKIIAAMG